MHVENIIYPIISQKSGPDSNYQIETIELNSLSSTLTVVATDEDDQISTLSQQLDLKWLPQM
jgi:hypothetical protein